MDLSDIKNSYKSYVDENTPRRSMVDRYFVRRYMLCMSLYCDFMYFAHNAVMLLDNYAGCASAVWVRRRKGPSNTEGRYNEKSTLDVLNDA
jgi:hypothetical protein